MKRNTLFVEFSLAPAIQNSLFHRTLAGGTHSRVLAWNTFEKYYYRSLLSLSYEFQVTSERKYSTFSRRREIPSD